MTSDPTVLPATAIVTFIVRYGVHGNRIIKILGRDGGLYSLALLGMFFWARAGHGSCVTNAAYREIQV